MFITKKGERSFVGKVLPYNRTSRCSDGTNIKRREIDYGEMHLQLIDTQAALALGVYDERIQEGQELDGGLVWRKAGRSIWFEPESIVVYDFPRRIEHPGDIAFFCWRWNAANLIPGYKVMHEKWGMDMTEAGIFQVFSPQHERQGRLASAAVAFPNGARHRPRNGSRLSNPRGNA